MQDPKIKHATEEFFDAILELQRESYHSELQSFEAHKNQAAKQMQERADEYWENLSEGHRLAMEGLKNEADKLRLTEALTKIRVRKVDAESRGSRDVPDDLMLSLYELSLSFFDEKKYEEAKKVLVFLTFLNPFLPTLWIAEGRVLEAMQAEDLAVESYKMAIFANPEEIEGYKNCIRCLLKAGKANDALTIAKAGIEAGEDLPSDFRNEMEQIREYVVKQGGK